jgi:7-cyano-7-deazaguanine synthase
VSVAVVLVSGGLDSAVTLAVAKRDGHECIAVTFDYGQRHRVELACAAKVVAAIGVQEHRLVNIDASALAGSALTGGGPVPHGRSESAIGQGIPDTYVPARNLVFLSHALAIAETAGARSLYIGANAVDYSGYPDCRDVFLKSFQATANLATKAGIQAAASPSDTCGFVVHAPLLDLPKANIIRLGHSLGIDFSMTSSCYDPTADGGACGTCDSCVIRAAGFAAAAID